MRELGSVTVLIAHRETWETNRIPMLSADSFVQKDTENPSHDPVNKSLIKAFNGYNTDKQRAS